jgi:hypothetical protein
MDAVTPSPLLYLFNPILYSVCHALIYVFLAPIPAVGTHTTGARTTYQGTEGSGIDL